MTKIEQDREAERARKREVMFKFLVRERSAIEAWAVDGSHIPPRSPEDVEAIGYLWDLVETLEQRRQKAQGG